jgi:hypothetical protein
MERGEQVANGSMGRRGWQQQHETQQARGVSGLQGGFKSEDEGTGTRGFEGTTESRTSLRLGHGAPVDQAALPPARSLPAQRLRHRATDVPGPPQGRLVRAHLDGDRRFGRTRKKQTFDFPRPCLWPALLGSWQHTLVCGC